MAKSKKSERECRHVIKNRIAYNKALQSKFLQIIQVSTDKSIANIRRELLYEKSSITRKFIKNLGAQKNIRNVREKKTSYSNVRLKRSKSHEIRNVAMTVTQFSQEQAMVNKYNQAPLQFKRFFFPSASFLRHTCSRHWCVRLICNSLVLRVFAKFHFFQSQSIERKRMVNALKVYFFARGWCCNKAQLKFVRRWPHYCQKFTFFESFRNIIFTESLEPTGTISLIGNIYFIFDLPQIQWQSVVMNNKW